MTHVKKKYDLIVFDWDGTLYDSVGYTLFSLKQAVDDLKWPMFDELEYKALSGLAMSNIIDALYSDVSPENREMLKIRYQFHALIHRRDTILYPGTKEILAILKSYGYLLAVATGKSALGLLHDLENVNLTDWFDATRTADQTALKPDAMMLDQIMEITHISPNRTLMVGDSVLDIQMAINAGTDSVGINTDPKDRAALLAQGAKTAITELKELLMYLGIK